MTNDTKNPSVTIGIANWNCGPFLERCLQSVFSQTLDSLEVILVDNASTDGSVEMVEARFPQVRVFRNARNEGFAKAQNQAIRASSGAEFYMPLNPDTELEPDFIAVLVEALQARPEFGYATGLAYIDSDDPDLQHVVYSAGHLFHRSCYAYNRLFIKQVHPHQLQEGEVGGASGVCPLYRRRMLDDIELEGEFFDELYFLYSEDVDLDWRAHLRGWRCWFSPAAVARHVMEGAWPEARSRILAQIVLNRHLTVLKNFDWPLFLWHLPGVAKYDFLHILPLLARHPGCWPFLISGFFRNALATLRKRRLVHAGRRWSPEEIRRWMDDNLRQRLEDWDKFMKPKVVRVNGRLKQVEEE